MPKPKKKRDAKKVTDDPRVLSLAECVIFAVNNFPNKPVFCPGTGKMESWHAWFKRTMTDAGYTLVEPPVREKK